MKKILYITVVLLLTGAGCINNKVGPNTKNNNEELPITKVETNVSTTTTDKPLEESSIKNDQKNYLNPFSSNDSKIFSDPETEFTFEYPSSWTIEKNSKLPAMQENTKFKMWNFKYKNNVVLELGAPPYESAYDGCAMLDPERIPADFYSEIKFYSTNDEHTSVLKEVCGHTTYIIWYPGFNPRLIKDLSPNDKQSIEKLHIIRLYTANFVNGMSNTSKPPRDFLEWANRIAGSIKIK